MTVKGHYSPIFCSCRICKRELVSSSLASHSHHAHQFLYPKPPNTYGNCPQCATEIRGYESKKFCNSICAAKFNNALRSSESRDQQKVTLKNTLEEKFGPKKIKIAKLKSVPLKEGIDFCKISYSSITGAVYHPKLKSPKGWHNPSRISPAKLLASMFDFELGQPDSIRNIELAIKNLEMMIRDLHMTPAMIKEQFNVTYSNFSMFIQQLGIQLDSVSVGLQKANETYLKDTSDYLIYQNRCAFTFKWKDLPKIKGSHLLSIYGMYNPITNLDGVCRDHRISKKYGFDNNISAEIISHPANCEFLFNSDNCSKGKQCSLKLEELIELIANW